MKKWIKGIYYGLFTGTILGLISFLVGEVCQRFLGSGSFELCRLSIMPFFLLSKYFNRFSEGTAMIIAIVVILLLFIVIGGIIGFILDKKIK